MLKMLKRPPRQCGLLEAALVTENHVQKFYWVCFYIKIFQKEKLTLGMMVTEALGNLPGSSRAGMSFQNSLQLKEGGPTFISLH